VRLPRRRMLRNSTRASSVSSCASRSVRASPKRSRQYAAGVSSPLGTPDVGDDPDTNGANAYARAVDVSSSSSNTCRCSPLHNMRRVYAARSASCAPVVFVARVRRCLRTRDIAV
jgi:hypothetical protein